MVTSNDSILPSGMTRCSRGISTRTYQHARKILSKMLVRSYVDLRPFVAHRYAFTLLPESEKTAYKHYLRDGDSESREPIYGWKYKWLIEPIGGVKGKTEYHDVKRYKLPDGVNAVEEVPDSPGLVFRGMCWEEWAEVTQSGWIRSKGWWNLGQVGLTFFGDAGQAQNYASGFTPWFFKPGKDVPGVVVGVDKKLTLGPLDDPKQIPSNERAVRGRIPMSAIKQVWIVYPKEAYVAEGEVVSERGSTDLYGSTPSVWCVAFQVEMDR